MLVEYVARLAVVSIKVINIIDKESFRIHMFAHVVHDYNKMKLPDIHLEHIYNALVILQGH
jgi:hypothetical protein